MDRLAEYKECFAELVEATHQAQKLLDNLGPSAPLAEIREWEAAEGHRQELAKKLSKILTRAD